MAPDNKYFQRMNQALDEELSRQELEVLHEEVNAAPDTAEHWRRLRTTDHLLRSTPMIHPSPGFADRVMAALSAVPLPAFARRYPGVGVALGLALAALLAVPVLWVVLWLLVSVVTDPGSLNSLLEAVINAVSAVSGLGWDAVQALRDAVQDTPLLAVLLVATPALTALWGWLLWVLLGGTTRLWPRQKS